MAFVCPISEENAESQRNCCVCCICKEEPKQRHHEPEPNHHDYEPELPEILICFKECDRSKQYRHGDRQDNGHHHHHGKEAFHKLSQSKSRELRASILYTGCDCLKRDGLQHDCRRTGCHGCPECIVQPPVCKPSQIVEGRNRLREKIRERAINRSKNGNKNQKGDSHGNGHGAVNYRCYPARLKIPAPCCMQCPSCLD